MRKKSHSGQPTFSYFKDVREFEGLTQSEMAKLMEIKPQCLQAFENTSGKISIRNLIKFWKVIGIDANAMLSELEKDLIGENYAEGTENNN